MPIVGVSREAAYHEQWNAWLGPRSTELAALFWRCSTCAVRYRMTNFSDCPTVTPVGGQLAVQLSRLAMLFAPSITRSM
jgi:hypothetical protein